MGVCPLLFPDRSARFRVHKLVVTCTSKQNISASLASRILKHKPLAILNPTCREAPCPFPNTSILCHLWRRPKNLELSGLRLKAENLFNSSVVDGQAGCPARSPGPQTYTAGRERNLCQGSNMQAQLLELLITHGPCQQSKFNKNWRDNAR